MARKLIVQPDYCNLLTIGLAAVRLQRSFYKSRQKAIKDQRVEILNQNVRHDLPASFDGVKFEFGSFTLPDFDRILATKPGSIVVKSDLYYGMRRDKWIEDSSSRQIMQDGIFGFRNQIPIMVYPETAEPTVLYACKQTPEDWKTLASQKTVESNRSRALEIGTYSKAHTDLVGCRCFGQHYLRKFDGRILKQLSETVVLVQADQLTMIDLKIAKVRYL